MQRFVLMAISGDAVTRARASVNLTYLTNLISGLLADLGFALIGQRAQVTEGWKVHYNDCQQIEMIRFGISY
jgi:hypothetical protein